MVRPERLTPLANTQSAVDDLAASTLDSEVLNILIDGHIAIVGARANGNDVAILLPRLPLPAS